MPVTLTAALPPGQDSYLGNIYLDSEAYLGDHAPATGHACIAPRFPFGRITDRRAATTSPRRSADVDRQPSSTVAAEREGCPSEGSATLGGRLADDGRRGSPRELGGRL